MRPRIVASPETTTDAHVTSPQRDRFEQFCSRCIRLDDPAVELDFSQAQIEDQAIQALLPSLQRALSAMEQIDGGAVANADEGRMVGHYWLRAPFLAPSPDIQDEIAATLARIETFALDVLEGRVLAPSGKRYAKLVLCGIGGSALGPMLLGDAFLGRDSRALQLCVLDNTDPDGIDRELGKLGALDDALVLVVSKSGGTPETRNGMLEVMRTFAAKGLAFGPQAVAITTTGSALFAIAQKERFLATFPMWDWVGGRTSITSAVGLLPGALLGMDVRAFLAGAAAMDAQSRSADVRINPSAMLAAYWHVQGRGHGERAMVVLPYKDRLVLLSRYLQQLVMESIGKKLDRKGREVLQGLSVYGNKGSTDQHAYVQQLRDGRHDFFATFVRVLRDRDAALAAFEVEPQITAGDYLDGFWQGTRAALAESGRASLTITLDAVDERSLGAIVALFERAVGIYAELIDVNAYHQPGVEAGKKAAALVLSRQKKVQGALTADARTAQQIAASIGEDATDCWPILCHLAANGRARRLGAPDPKLARFQRA
jgi:glucose-6-phosphate isomerase